MIGPKGLKFSGFDGSYSGVVIRKFGENVNCLWDYYLFIYLFFFFLPKCPGWDHNS